MKHFNRALEIIKPSINDNMLRYYLEWGVKARQQLPRSHLKPQVYV
jgi:transitional endoplasmic reticulum ATPase